MTIIYDEKIGNRKLKITCNDKDDEDFSYLVETTEEKSFPPEYDLNNSESIYIGPPGVAGNPIEARVETLDEIYQFLKDANFEESELNRVKQALV